MEREIVFRAAFDKRHPNPSKNYGIHGVECAFYLKGPDGAIQFVLYTNWMLPHVQKELDSKPANRDHFHCHPLPADLGYHSKIPRYEGHKPLTENCPIIGGRCYYDGSSLQADEVFKLLLEGGSEGVWKRLEEEYQYRFSKNGHEC